MIVSDHNMVPSLDASKRSLREALADDFRDFTS